MFAEIDINKMCLNKFLTVCAYLIIFWFLAKTDFQWHPLKTFEFYMDVNTNIAKYGSDGTTLTHAANRLFVPLTHSQIGSCPILTYDVLKFTYWSLDCKSTF